MNVLFKYQNRVGSMGSRTVICPATPSSYPYLPKILKAQAKRSFTCFCLASRESKTGMAGLTNLLFGDSAEAVVWIEPVAFCVNVCVTVVMMGVLRQIVEERVREGRRH